MNSIPLRMIMCLGLALLALTALSPHALGQTFYVSSDYNELQEVAADGSVTNFGQGNSGVAVDASGNVLAGLDAAGVIDEIPAGGGTETRFASNMAGVNGLVIDSNGDVYSSSGYGTASITYISSAGGSSPTTLTTTGVTLQNAYGLAFDTSGDLFVGGYNTGNLYEITPSGVASIFTTAVVNPIAVTVAGGDIFAASLSSGYVDKFAANGTLLDHILIPSGSVYGMTSDSAGNVYVVDSDAALDGSGNVVGSDLLEIAAGSSSYTVVSDQLLKNSDYVAVESAIPEPKASSLILVGLAILARLGFRRRQISI